ncbi:hypothetical protein ACIA8G_32100 [Lentzea sp. NPDC051213]|uniref:hypothetical protein n=1 Tax=Lentzea sp. NPDC051213 TaxID=3364126 RepID=UPI00378AB5BC
MRAQRLKRIGTTLVGAGVALLAGMVVAALTLPVTGYAAMQVWVAVGAVALGPLYLGRIFLRSSLNEVTDRLTVPMGMSPVLVCVAGFAVRDHYLEHPDTPITASTVLYVVVTVLSLLLTWLGPLTIGPLLGPEELRTRPVDVRALRAKGRKFVVIGSLLTAGLAVTGVLLPVSPGGDNVLLAALGMIMAGCSVVTAVLLTQVNDLRGGYRSYLVTFCLILAGIVCVYSAGPFSYLLLVVSTVAGIAHVLLFFAALVVICLCGNVLARFLGQHGVLPPSRQWPAAQPHSDGVPR